MMRIALLSSGEFGLPTLECLGSRLRLVVSCPARPSGRGLRARPAPVAARAREMGIPVLACGQVNRAETLERLAESRPEVIIVADFGQRLEKKLRSIPEKEIINLHPSLLPRYRGSAPVERAVLNRERQTGVSLIRVTGKMDAGPLLLQEKTAVGEEETAPELAARLAVLAARLTGEALEKIEKGEAVFTPQDENAATSAPRIRKEEGRVNWATTARDIAAQTRAFAGWPGTWAFLPPGPGGREKRRLFIRSSRACPESDPGGRKPGTVLRVDRAGILVACGKGCLLLREVQAPGRRKVTAADYALGDPFIKECVLE